MLLTINEFNEQDEGVYVCVASNTLGRANSTIRLYGEIPANKSPLTQILLKIFHSTNLPEIKVSTTTTTTTQSTTLRTTGSLQLFFHYLLILSNT